MRVSFDDREDQLLRLTEIPLVEKRFALAQGVIVGRNPEGKAGTLKENAGE